MENQLFDFIKELEEKPANFLFQKKESYNYTYYLKTEKERKLFCMVCKNYLRDSENENNCKILTIRYWFLHNIFHLMQKEKIKDDGILELKVLLDYINFTNAIDWNDVFFLPGMNRFGGWINLTNIQKNDLHCKIIKDLLYLDDNYFFFMHYLKCHNIKFLEKIFRKTFDDKDNNFMMHFVRSAHMKNNDIAFKNFRKIWMYFQNIIFNSQMVNQLKEKNKTGMRAIHYISFLKKKYYYFICGEIFKNMTFKKFMETIFWQLIRNMCRYWQFEFILEKTVALNNEEIGFIEMIIPHKNKFEKLYKRLLNNKSIPFNDKLNMLSNMCDYGLIEIKCEDREKMGKRLWQELSLYIG